MTFTDPIGDMFSRIRNGQMRLLNSVVIPSSNFRRNILEILKNEGYIKDYFIEKSKNNKISLKVNLKYYEGDPVIKEIKRISKPGRRVYSRSTSIPKVMNGLGLAILSTPKGVMSDVEARKNNLDSFEYTNKAGKKTTYVKFEMKTGMVAYKAKK